MNDKSRFEEERERMEDVKEQFPAPNIPYEDIQNIKDEEVQESVDEINPDKNSMNSRG